MNAMNASREFFARQHEAAEADAARQIEIDAEQEKRAVLRSLAEFCKGEVDLSSAAFEDGVVTFPDGLCLFFYREYGAGSRDAFRVRGQCPQCGEMCWSGLCFAPDRVGGMLEEFTPHKHSCPGCPVPDEERPIAVGDTVNVEGVESVILGSVKVLVTPRDGGGCWQFVFEDSVYAVGAGAPFLIIRKGKGQKGQ